MTEGQLQREIFLREQGDAWFRRNQAGDTSQLDDFDRVIASSVGAPSSVLEIGCADGRRLSRLSSHLGHPEMEVGIDPSSEAIADARNRHPSIRFEVGTADRLPINDTFELVILGFCLYLCDRPLLPRIVAETDRVLSDGGTLAIIDFDPPSPRRRRFRHHEGLWSYKMDYSQLFTAFPQYVLSTKSSMSHHGPAFTPDETERVAVWVLNKSVSGGYAEESDA